MTVEGLIAELQTLPKDAIVEVWDHCRARWMPLEAIDAGREDYIRVGHRVYVHDNDTGKDHQYKGTLLHIPHGRS